MRIGIDLGGSKIEIIALDAAGNTLLRQRLPTPTGNYRKTLSTIKQLITWAEKQLGQEGTVGIGIPGSSSPTTRLIRNANSTCLNAQPLQQDIQQLLQREVRIANDANCFTLSEASDGAAAGAASVFGIILGTGTGGGIVINGKLHEGTNLIAGEWGHNPLPWMNAEEFPGPACWCGKQGCIETFLSGPGLSSHYQEITGEAHSAEKIATAAERGNKTADALLQRYESRLARALASVINLLDPACIVLGGGLSNLHRLYQNVPSLLPEYVFSDSVNTRILPPLHGDSSGVRGAAWLWPADENK
jgi:predicted NBD/HSP70 family sugar kinase